MGVSDWLQAFNTVIALLALAFVARATTILANQTKTFVEQAQSMRRQNEIANRVALVSAFDELTTKAMALDQFFFENPDMKRYVYGDEPLPAAGTVQSEQVESVCEILCDLMELDGRPPSRARCRVVLHLGQLLRRPRLPVCGIALLPRGEP